MPDPRSVPSVGAASSSAASSSAASSSAASSSAVVSGSGRIFYQSLRVVARALMKVWFRIEVRGTEHVPTSGGYILAPGGHRSILDTPVVSALTPRMLRYMGAEKFFAVPGFGWFLRSVGGFPVERNLTDREAFRISEQILRAGEPLVVFPESTRFEGPLVMPFKEGAVFLAARAGVPIVPVGIGGAERALPRGRNLPRPTKMALVIGRPIVVGNADGSRMKRSEVSAATTRLHAEVQALFDEAQIRAGA
jgi:1-acyl-sn-glycerol-3-phosphate acyltransferase